MCRLELEPLCATVCDEVEILLDRPQVSDAPGKRPFEIHLPEFSVVIAHRSIVADAPTCYAYRSTVTGAFDERSGATDHPDVADLNADHVPVVTVAM